MNNLSGQETMLTTEYYTLKNSLAARIREISRLRSELYEAETEARFLQMDLSNKEYLLELLRKKDRENP